MSSSNSSQRYLPAASSQARLADPYSNLPPRGRDMALPPTSSVGAAYERSSRNVVPPPPINPGPLLRRPQSRERFDDRGYIPPTERRERSPPISNALRREPMETSHWERPKPRDSAHYESGKYFFPWHVTGGDAVGERVNSSHDLFSSRHSQISTESIHFSAIATISPTAARLVVIRASV